MDFETLTIDEGNLIKIKAYGAGFGHGVGLSQYGAGYMATNLHKSYEEILQHYYNGISIGTEPFILSSNTEQDKMTQSFYTKNKKARLVIDNKYKLNYIDANINGLEEKIILDSSERINKIDIFIFINCFICFSFLESLYG